MHDQNHNFTALLIHTLICTVYQANKGAIQWSDFLASKVGCVWHISHNMCNPLYRISQNLQEYPVHALLFCRSVTIRHIRFAAAIRWLTGVKTISRRRGRVEWIFLGIARVASLRFFFFQDNRRHLWDSSGKCPMNTLKIWIALHAEKKQVGSYRIDIVIVTALYGYVQTRGRFWGWLRSQLAPTKKVSFERNLAPAPVLGANFQKSGICGASPTSRPAARHSGLGSTVNCCTFERNWPGAPDTCTCMTSSSCKFLIADRSRSTKIIGNDLTYTKTIMPTTSLISNHTTVNRS